MVEILIVAVLVLWSTVVVFKKVFPKTANKTFGVLAEQTQKQGWNTVSKWLATRKLPRGSIASLKSTTGLQGQGRLTISPSLSGDIDKSFQKIPLSTRA